jgi:hypothetical protein
MRNRIWVLLLCINWFGLVASAQTSAKRQLVVPVSTGGYVSFKSETSAIDKQGPADPESFTSLLHSQALTDENRIIHRILTDAENHVIFGYDLSIKSDPTTRKFSLIVLPADSAFRRTQLKDSKPRIVEYFATFPTSTEPQTLDDGDAVSLELLVNKESGLKIVDVVRVTFDRSRLIDGSPSAPPKDFTLDAVALTVKGYELLIDGSLVSKSKATIGCTGSILWFYVPGRGRFIFSLVPRDGYSFQKTGLLDGNRIEFLVNGRLYEWVSSAPILPNGGTWNLWVLQDENYTPLFGLQKPVEKDKQKQPGVFDKLNDAMTVRSGNDSLTLNSPLPKIPKQRDSKVEIPQRVMVGGADSMDHVLPKSP